MGGGLEQPVYKQYNKMGLYFTALHRVPHFQGSYGLESDFQIN